MVEQTEALEPSTEAEVIEDENAESSPVSETEEDLLSVIQDAAQPAEEPESQSGYGDEEDEEQGDFETSNGEFPEPVEDFTDVPFHKHPRFKQVLERSGTHTRKTRKNLTLCRIISLTTNCLARKLRKAWRLWL